MREFTFDIEQEFRRGLRPDERSGKIGEFLYECVNAKPTAYGIESIPEPINPFAVLPDIEFPSPQLFRGHGYTLLVGAREIWSVVEDPNGWTVGSIQLYDRTGAKTEAVPKGGGYWHFVDLGGTINEESSWMLFNGQSVVFRTGLNRLFNEANLTYLDNQRVINTGTKFRGRIISGGFKNSSLWDSSWLDLFSDWESANVEGYDFTFADIGKNWVMWSSIGGGDFPMWLMLPDKFKSRFNFPDQDTIFQRLRRNEFGWSPMPFVEEIVAMVPFQDKVVVYGGDGIAAMIPHSDSGLGLSTFGIREVENIGLAGRGAVAISGDKSVQVFVDRFGTLWTLSSDLALTRLGYEEFLRPLILEGGEIVITYDSGERHFYICGTHQSFVLTGDGLGETTNRITGGAYVGAAEGFTAIYDRIGTTETRIVTREFDLGIRGIKTITSIGLQMVTCDDVEVAVDYRYLKTQEFIRSPWIRLNNEGNAVARYSGIDFRIAIRAPRDIFVDLDRIRVRWQASDKRFIRGNYVSEASAGAG